MDEPAIEDLAQFCADQFSPFDSAAWLIRSGVDGKATAVAAKYLSMTSWYGHEEELERIASRSDACIKSISGFHKEAKAIGLNLTSLSTSVRRKIALRQRSQSTKRINA